MLHNVEQCCTMLNNFAGPRQCFWRGRLGTVLQILLCQEVVIQSTLYMDHMALLNKMILAMYLVISIVALMILKMAQMERGVNSTTMIHTPLPLTVKLSDTKSLL